MAVVHDDIHKMDTHPNSPSSASSSPSPTLPDTPLVRIKPSKAELWRLMHDRAQVLRGRLDRLDREKSDPVFVCMWRDLVYGLANLLSEILGRQAELGASGWAREMRRVIAEKKMPEEKVMLIMAHTLVAMERALRHRAD